MRKANLPTILILALLALGGLLTGGGPGRAAPAPQPAPGSAAGDWPMYGHDPSRTGANLDETAINTGNVAQLVQRWQANIGTGAADPFSGPVVANGRVYVGSSIESGDNFFAFDALTGKKIWSTDIGHGGGCFNVGIGSTAAISGTTLVVGGGDPAYYGLNAETGARLWRNPMDVGSSGFAWTSPLLAYGRAYVGIASRCDNPSVRGEIRALDLQSGQQVATQYFVPTGKAGAGIWNSPTLSPDGKTLVVATGEDFNGYNGAYNRAMVSLDPITLQIKEAHQEGALNRDVDYGTTPVIFHDNKGRMLVGATHKDNNFYVYDLNNIDAGAIWHREIGRLVGMMPAYDPNFGDGGTLFMVGSTQQLYAVDPATGADRWPRVDIGQVRGNMAVANGLLFLNGGAGGFLILDETTGKVLRGIKDSTTGSTNSGPAIAHGFVYWLSGRYLNAWSLPGYTPPTAGPTAPAGSPTVAPTPGTPAFANPAFANVWTRTDSLVANHSTDRSWFWGPAPISGPLQESYREGPSGQHLVQYFDKSRMEINNPNGDKTSPFYVTNGLLVVELISGRLQIGDSSYETRTAATLNVAGDQDDPNAPTYTSFRGVANTTLGDHKAPDHTGQFATATLNRAGAVGDNPALRKYTGIDFAHYEPATGHNIPRVFWDFLNQKGPVIENGQVITAQLINPWFYASGLPISEPYWATVRVAGTPRDVLIQAFERRVLTYNPANNAAFQVEMGNVGQHYYAWRYRQ
jgi:outer membrane protein assembly factor BamB